MELAVLGPLEVRAGDGSVIPVTSASQRRILGALIAHRGATLEAERLAEMNAMSVASLRTGISRLRATLGSEVVVTVGSGYALGEVAVDLDRFAELLGQAREAEVGDRLGLFDSALSLWRGEPLGEFADFEWAQPFAVELVELVAAAREDRVEALVGLGRFADAVAAAGSHVEVYPLRDRPRGLLMRALAAEGRQSEALRAYQDYRKYLGEELGTVPGDALVELENRIAAGWHDAVDGHAIDVAPVRGVDPHLTNLRSPATELVGREAELVTLVEMIREHRLVTLVGVGGVGKTRLAVEAAANLLPDFPDGVWFCDLAPVSGTRALLDTVGATLDLRLQPSAALDDLVASLASKRALVVLDNAEHIVGDVAELVEALEGGARRLHLLTTSREALVVGGERTVALTGLEVPDGVEDVADTAALRLFAARAAERDASFALGDNRAAIVEICRRLDGLPLALELAAARLSVLSASEIVDRLDQHLDILTGGRRRAQGRQQTLRSTIGWSHDLLDEHEQRAFVRLSVFATSFELESAEVVLADLDVSPLEIIGSLVDKSLLTAEHLAPTTRYRYLETIRQYAAERLEQAGGLPAAMEAMTRYALPWARRCARGLGGDAEVEWVERRNHELPNLQRVFDWAMQGHDIDTVTALLAPFGELGFPGSASVGALGVQAVEAFDEAIDEHPLGSRVLALAATHDVFANGPQHATRYTERAVAAWDPTRHPGPVELVVHHSILGPLEERVAEAFEIATQAAEIAEELDEPLYLVPCLCGIALWGGMLGKVDGTATAERAYAVALEAGNATNIGAAAYCLGMQLRRSDPEAALDVAIKGAEAARALGDAMYGNLEVEVCVTLAALGRESDLVQRALPALGNLHLASLVLEVALALCPALTHHGHAELAARIVGRAEGGEARIQTLYTETHQAALTAVVGALGEHSAQSHRRLGSRQEPAELVDEVIEALATLQASPKATS